LLYFHLFGGCNWDLQLFSLSYGSIPFAFSALQNLWNLFPALKCLWNVGYNTYICGTVIKNTMSILNKFIFSKAEHRMCLAMKNAIHVPIKRIMRNCWRNEFYLKICAWKYHNETPLLQLIYADKQLQKTSKYLILRL
jgi:hypothetical protein